MALNIGTLVTYLSIDDSAFTRKADQADRKLQAMKLHLDAIDKSNPKVHLEVTESLAKIKALQDRLAELRAKPATAEVKVEMAQALIDLDRIQMKVRELHGKTIRIDVDDSKVKTATGNVNLLGTAITALGPTLIPITRAVAGFTFSLLGPITAATAGIGLYAAAAKSAASSTMATATQLKALQTQAQKATTAKGRQSALDQYAKLYATLNPAQLQFIANEQKMSGAWGKLTHSDIVLGPLSQGMKALTALMPKLAPLLTVVSKDLQMMMVSLTRGVQSKGFDTFIKGFTTLAGSSIRVGFDALGNFIKGFVGLMGAFSGQGVSFLGTIDNISKKFAAWGTNASKDQGVQNFLAYLKKEGPIVAHTLGDLGTAIGHLLTAAAPFGGVMLRAVDVLAKLVDAIPPSVLGPMVTGLLGLKLALDFSTATKGFSGLASLPGVFGTLGGKLQFSAKQAGLMGLGLGALSMTASSSNKMIGILGSAAAGAIGGAGFGPWGAVIGGAGGALLGLITHLHDTKKPLQDATQLAHDYASTLDQVSGAVTDATKRMAIQKLQDSGDLKTLLAAGLRVDQIGTGAISGTLNTQLNNRKATLQKQFNSLYGGMNKDQQQYYSANKDNPDSAYSLSFIKNGPQLKAVQAQIDAINAAEKSLGATTAAVSTQTQAEWQQTLGSVSGVHDALNRLPHAAVTHIIAEGAGKTMDQMTVILARYKATPSQIQTFLHALGTDETVQQIQQVIDKANAANKTPVSIKVTADVAAAVQALKNIGPFFSGVRVPGVIGKATGGMINGPGSATSDSIPARLSNGEFVVNAAATARHRQLLEAINGHGYATGGIVTPGQLAASLGPLPASSHKTHHGSRSSAAAAAARAARAATAQQKRNLANELAYVNSLLSGTNSHISAASNWASSFGSNVFGAGLMGTPTTTHTMVNGIPVTMTGTQGTNASILSQMFAYQKGQRTQALGLAADVANLRRKGISQAVLAQMQGAGPSGIAEIHALASATRSQVQQFNALNAQTTNALNNAGAYATSGQSFSALQQQKMNETQMKNILTAGLHGKPIPVQLVNGHLRVMG